MITIGMDPGKKGALVALRDGEPIEWLAADDRDGGYVIGKEYAPTVIRAWLQQVIEIAAAVDDRIAKVVIEKQQARPIEGRSSVLTTGYGFGLLVGVTAGLGLPFEIVTVGKWQRAMFGAGKAKDTKGRAIVYVSGLVPDLALTWGRRTKPHDGLADACCLALWGAR